jgi:hypothetical protein
MNNQINSEGILTFKALTLSKSVFSQIAKVCGNRNGKLIGYVLDEYQMATFIGTEDGKLYRTRQDYMIETWQAQGKTDMFVKFQDYLKSEMSKLPQIFLK